MTMKIDRLDDLEAHFSKYKNGYLFRGQNKHYLDQHGDTSIPTSFARHGCIPDVMFKWTHYSKALIRAFSGRNYFEIDTEVSQAILQHYGWRSFYVDLTKSSQIACWFAANSYREKESIHMSEDVNENPVWLVHKDAAYSEFEGCGHIYIIDCLSVESLGIKIHDLTVFQGDEGRLRFHAQQACLVGHLSGSLPAHTIASHVEVPHSVLKEYYQQSGIKNLNDVFPSRREDFVLDMLLSLPWEKVNIESPIPAFRRGLEIPDYEENFVKHLPPGTALYENFWLADNCDEDSNPFNGLVFYKIPQFFYYANKNKRFNLEFVTAALEQHGDFVIEIDGLIKIFEETEEYIFEKGVHVSALESGCISISGLVISHPSSIVSGVGTNVGWIYKIENKRWVRVDHPEQCPCNNDLRHELQFSLLEALNEALKEKQFLMESSETYVHKEIKKD